MEMPPIPGYVEAVEREEFFRAAAFLRLNERLCGLEVLPLTTRHLLWLEVIESPFVTGAPIPMAEAHLHVAAFVRVVTPGFNAFSWWRRRLFFRNYRRGMYGEKIAADAAVTAVKEYRDEAFGDRPARRGTHAAAASYWSTAAGMCHELCSNYSMSIDEALDVPLKVVFQLLKVQDAFAQAKSGKKPVLFNPSDSVVTRYYTERETEENRLN